MIFVNLAVADVAASTAAMAGQQGTEPLGDAAG
jgi:hypothetical protein